MVHFGSADDVCSPVKREAANIELVTEPAGSTPALA
jgi:hypothetical protein